MYSPTYGRFLQTDPIGYGDGMNMYAYVGNDPVNGVDPSGMSCAAAAGTPCVIDVVGSRPGYGGVIGSGVGPMTMAPAPHSLESYCANPGAYHAFGFVLDASACGYGDGGGSALGEVFLDDKAKSERKTCRADPMFQEMFRTSGFSDAIRTAVTRQFETGDEHGFWFGIVYPDRGNRHFGFSAIGTSGRNAYVSLSDLPQASAGTGNVAIPMILVHTHPPYGREGLSWARGDIAVANQRKIGIVAYDMESRNFYCYNGG